MDDYRHTNEYLDTLLIHPYVRDKLPCEGDLRTFFCDPSFLKIFVIRDPLERLVSAVTSKYLLPGSSYFGEIARFGYQLPTHYESPDHFSEVFNEVVRLLMLKTLSSSSFGSHVVPIATRYSNFLRSNFDFTIDVSRGTNGFNRLHKVLSDHILSVSGIEFPSFDRLNESPIGTNLHFLQPDSLSKALVYFDDDYRSFDFEKPDVSSWTTVAPSAAEIQSFNLFVGVISRFYEVSSKSRQYAESINDSNLLLGQHNEKIDSLKTKLRSSRNRVVQLEQQLSELNCSLKLLRETQDKTSNDFDLVFSQLLLVQEELEKLFILKQRREKENKRLKRVNQMKSNMLSKQNQLQSKLFSLLFSVPQSFNDSDLTNKKTG